MKKSFAHPILPFADGGFGHVLSIAALCFVADERQAVAEMCGWRVGAAQAMPAALL